MRYLFVSLLALAACARAQSVVGTYYIPNDGNNVSGVIPDVSVLGIATITDTSNDNGDGGVMTIQTAPNPTTTTTEPAPATVTQCWKVVTAESSTTSTAVQPTLVDGGSPPGVQCWLVYQGDGGIISLPIPQKVDSSASHSNKATTLVLPIVLSLVGVVLLAGGILTFLHVRNKKRRAANRASGEKHAWVNRKSGWANMADEEAGVTRPDVAQVARD